MVNTYSQSVPQLPNNQFSLYGQRTPGIGTFIYPPSPNLYSIWSNITPLNISISSKPIFMNSLGSLFGANAPAYLKPTQLAGYEQINIPALGPNIIPMNL